MSSFAKIYFKPWHIGLFPPVNKQMTKGKVGYFMRNLKAKGKTLEEFQTEYMKWYNRNNTNKTVTVGSAK